MRLPAEIQPPKHLQVSTMEVRVPRGALIRTLSIVSIGGRRLSQDQRKRMRGLWRLNAREYRLQKRTVRQ